MPLPLLALLAASAIGGALGKRGGTSTSTQRGDTHTTSDTAANFQNFFENYGENFQLPVEDEGTTALGGDILKQISGRLNNPYRLPAGFISSGISAGNQAYKGAATALHNRLIASGLSRSGPAASGYSRLESDRARSITDFLNQVPMIERQFAQEDLGNAMNFYRSVPRGTYGATSGSGTQAGTSATSGTQHTSSTGAGTQTVPGNMAGGAFDNLASMMGWLARYGMLPGMNFGSGGKSGWA